LKREHGKKARREAPNDDRDNPDDDDQLDQRKTFFIAAFITDAITDNQDSKRATKRLSHSAMTPVGAHPTFTWL
jgi:hypothetical protein